MIYLSNLQKETLLKVDEMINENKTFNEIQNYLYDNDYIFSQEVKNGYRSKTRFSIEKLPSSSALYACPISSAENATPTSISFFLRFLSFSTSIAQSEENCKVRAKKQGS